MNSETKQCQNCKKDFTIEPDDFAFYEKEVWLTDEWDPMDYAKEYDFCHAYVPLAGLLGYVTGYVTCYVTGVNLKIYGYSI